MSGPCLAQSRKLEKRTYRFLNDYYHNFNKRDKLAIETLTKVETVNSLENLLNFSFLDRKNPFSKNDSAVLIASLIDEDDLKYMKDQLRLWKDTRILNADQLKSINKILLIQDDRSEQERLFPSFNTHHIYFPLFNLEGNVALFYYEVNCGLQCGSGELEILKMQKNGKWQSIRKILVWIA
jgi:hypothetical protein